MPDEDERRKLSLEELREDATQRLLRVKLGEDPPEALEVWRHRSAHHAAMLDEAEQLWQQVGQTRVAAEFAATVPVLAQVRPPRRKPIGRRAVLGGAVAASGAAVMLGSGALGPLSGLFADYATGVGEQRSVTLPDGSVAHLNTASALSFQQMAQMRLASFSTGECLFEAAPDAAAPFVVEALQGSVRTAGGAFSLRRFDDAVRVLAVENNIEVMAAADSSELLELSPGQSMTYGGGLVLGPVETVDVEAATAWRRGKLVFNQRPLAEVVAELERYRQGRILILDSRLSHLPVTGVFDLADIGSTLAAIKAVLPVRVTHLPLVTLLS